MTFLSSNWACLLGEVGLFLGRLSIFRSLGAVHRAGGGAAFLLAHVRGFSVPSPSVFEGMIVPRPFESMLSTITHEENVIS